MTNSQRKLYGQEILTYDPEESLLRAQIPLKEFRDILRKQDESKIVSIDFSRNGYCNDAVIKLIQSEKKKNYSNLREVILDGCMLISNAGVKWLAEIISGASQLQKLVLDGCPNLGDTELYLLAKEIGQMCEICMRGTNIRYISELEMNKVKVDNCPKFEAKLADINYSHAFIFPHKSMENSLCHLIKGKKKKREQFHYITNFMSNGWNFSLTEMNLDYPLFDVMLSDNPVQVIIPFDEKADVKDVEKHVTETVVKVISKTAFSTTYRKGKDKLEGSSNTPYIYGTAKVKLLRLAHKLDITKQLVPIVDDLGMTKGQLECSIEYCKENGEPLERQEPLRNIKHLLTQQIRLKVKINFATGLSQDLESTFCKFKFFHVFNHYQSTSEMATSNPYYNYEKIFFVRSVRQKLLSFLEKASLSIDVWGRKKIEVVMNENKEMMSKDLTPNHPYTLPIASLWVIYLLKGDYPLMTPMIKIDNTKEMKFAEDQSEYRACEFVVLRNGKEAEKLPMFKLQPEAFNGTLEEISTCIENQERNFTDLDIHSQSVYSSLCKTRERIEEFCNQIDKIQYMSTDLTSTQGVGCLQEKMADIMDYHKYHQGVKYCCTIKIKRILKIISDILQKEKIMDFDSTGKVGAEERDLKITGLEIMQLFTTLQEQGKCALLRLGLKTIIADVEFLQSVLVKLADTTSMEPCRKMSTAIGELSKVWRSEMIVKDLTLEELQIPVHLLRGVLHEYLGLIEIPAWRFTPEDTQFVYTVSNVLSPTPLSLREYWRGDETSKDFIVIKKKYSFIYPVSNTLLAGIQSSSTYYGRTMLLTPEGSVFQIGCVQTAIVKDTGSSTISVESRCYLPEKKSGSVNNLTETYVQQYTWNIFCLYTDIIEKILKQCNIVYLVSGEIPKGLVNISIGCVHDWKSSSGKTTQSVCTMCNKCCDLGRKCQYNGILGYSLRECSCKTSMSGCVDCGICLDCAERLWDMRSYLRPLPMTYSIDEEQVKMLEKLLKEKKEAELVEGNKNDTNNVMEDNPFKDLARNVDDLDADDKEIKKKCYIQVPLDPVTFNEMEVQHISYGSLGAVLREIDQESRLLVFPGIATTMDVENDMEDEAIAEKILNLTSNIVSYRYKFNPGDSVKIRITDPFKTITKDKPNRVNQSKDFKVVYHVAQCKEATVSHETGLLCYQTKQTNNMHQKAYFTGARPFSEKFKSFRIKILSIGKDKYIGIGVTAGSSKMGHNTGRDHRKADFIKYYINRGGIYNQKECIIQKEGSNVGDVLQLFCDVITNKFKLLKNGKEFFETAIEIPEGGYYPQITLNSEGECVKLMEKYPWRPDPNKITGNPAAFDIYKYSNLWISPATTIVMSSRRITHSDHTEQYLHGWIILHNPTVQQIGYMIYPNNFVKEPIGCLEPAESKPFPVFYHYRGRGINPFESGFKISWIVLEQKKDYTEEDITQIYEKTSGMNISQHRLNCVGNSSYQGDAGPLSLFNDAIQSEEDSYKLEIFKNSRFVNSYCLNKGRYVLELYSLLKGKEPVYILKQPKCPSFLYSPSIQVGMKSIVKLKRFTSKDEYAEALVTERVDRGFRLECTPGQSGTEFSVNDRLFCEESCVGIDDEEYKKIHYIQHIDAITIFEYTGSCKKSLLDSTYIPAPPYLVTKGSAALRKLLNPEWQTETLHLFSSCNQSITRPTIQEQIITQHSRTLLKWLRFRDVSIPYSSVFLPSKLDSVTLVYPQMSTMYNDVNVYRLCFFHEKYQAEKYRENAQEQSKNISSHHLQVKSLHTNIKKHYVTINDGNVEKSYILKIPQEVNLHFMDIPSYSLKKEVPADVSFGCLYQSWTYIALLANQILVPSYSQMFTGGTGDLHRHQIESLLYKLIQPYASLCGIYATQYGGLSNQRNPRNYQEKIINLCTNTKIPIADDNLTEDKLKDSHLFWNIEPFLTCMAHRNSFLAQNLITSPSALSLDKQYFQPHSENLNTLIINKHNLTSLPNDFCETFKNLCVLSIVEVVMTNSTVFPSGISQCKDLEIICISDVQGMTTLSPDILMGPSLSTFYLHSTPISKLDIDWPTGSLLSTLSLVGLQLEIVPKSISQLSNLQELILDYNPIIDLPEELESLVRLKTLSIKGIPWINIEGKSALPKVVFEQWHKQNPYILKYLTHQTVDKLFHNYDVNNNNVLDPTELANLNLYFMMRIPRLGLKKKDDKDFGVIPPVIFKLKSLQKLDLSFSAITVIPDKIKTLLKLHTLNLEHCPVLTSVSGHVGLLPNLRSMHLNSCPLLETPPLEIVGRGSDACKAFLKRIAGGFTECHRTKLMLIGLGQAGKTTLLKALRNESKKTGGAEETVLTDGIDIKPWIVPINHEGRQIDITYSCWDFAGQTVYYNTHQFFLSKQAVYMLLWNMRMGFEHAGLDFWLSSIACHCPEAPVIVVGTQLDQIPMPDIPEPELMEKYPQIKKFCYVSSTKGTNVPELQDTLIDVTMNHCSQMQVKIPEVWLSFENDILKKRNDGSNIMEWSAVKQCAIKNGLYEDKDIRLAVQFLNDLGTVQYFDTDFLRDRVVINPQWIVDVMAKVVSVNEKSIKENKGRFYHKFIPMIWKDYDPSLHQWMLKLTERFDLTFSVPEESDKFNIVPCLLPETKPKNLPWPYLSEDEGIRESTILYKFTYLPTGLFNRSQARLLSQGFTDQKLLDFLWKKGSILKKNQHYALVKQVNDYEMIVSVQGPRPKNVMDLIHETISTLINDAFVGVEYDYFVQCPDCVEKEGTKEPFLFKAELISRAYSVNAPFLQCTKFFHTVSIGELLRMMPESKETEFDVQIQESISALEEISCNIATDVAILYCHGDLPLIPYTPDVPAGLLEKIPVDPTLIYEDLKKAGYNCWFPTNVDTTTELEMTLAVKNSKVLLVCISENFVVDAKCRQMFLYATEQLHKPFAVAVIREALDWQQTDLGFKIGKPKMAMIKNMKRYPEKIKDLIDIVKDFIDDIEKIKLSTPSVFISYCWANSKEACSITTQARPGSLGYGDPRALKTYLENGGIRCWLDIEQMGKFGLYQDITVGLQNSKVLVICVSDEYLESDACMMESRFGVYNMLLPIVVCVVGTGKHWKDSEVSLMIQKQGELAQVVKMQKKSTDVYDTVLNYVKNYLQRPETEKQRKIRERLNKVKLRQEKVKKEDFERRLKQQGDTEFSYQEEVELIQRKFMRYVSKLSLMEDIDIPRLLVIDFSDQKQSVDTSLLKEVRSTYPGYANDLLDAINDAVKGNNLKAQAMHQTLMSQMDQPVKDEGPSDVKMSNKEELTQIQRMMDLLNECIEYKWEGKDFTLRVMCEYEQGWHFYGISLGLDKLMSGGSDNVTKLIKEAAPYLARFYTILKQSGVDLNSVSSPTGELFLSYIRKEGTSTQNFTEAYRGLCKGIEDFMKEDNWWLYEFPRCCLPNGKIAYLCEEHMDKVGATIIQYDTDNSGTGRVLLSEQDKHLRELLSENSEIKKMKANRLNYENNDEQQVKIESNLETVETTQDEILKEPTVIEKRPQTSESSCSNITQSSTSSQRVGRKKSQRRTSQACCLQ